MKRNREQYEHPRKTAFSEHKIQMKNNVIVLTDGCRARTVAWGLTDPGDIRRSVISAREANPGSAVFAFLVSDADAACDLHNRNNGFQT